MGKISTLTLPSFAAPKTSSATSCAESFTCGIQNYYYFGGKTSGYFYGDRQTGIVGYRKRPPFCNAHMALLVFEVTPPGAAPGPPVKPWARVRRFRVVTRPTYQPAALMQDSKSSHHVAA